MTAASKQVATRTETTAVIAKLREMLPPGSIAYTIVRRVSQSGMSRHISVVIPMLDLKETLIDEATREYRGEFTGGIEDITYLVARALEMRRDPDTGGIVVRGAGMDMSHALVYDLSHTLYPEGFGCIGPSCPSNDHSNGDRDYTPHNGAPPPAFPDPNNPLQILGGPHWHASGGCALSHKNL